jgi:ethanolamine utilization microcompartment shell protein EutL
MDFSVTSKQIHVNINYIMANFMKKPQNSKSLIIITTKTQAPEWKCKHQKTKSSNSTQIPAIHKKIYATRSKTQLWKPPKQRVWETTIPA